MNKKYSVYCDSGGYINNLKELEEEGIIEICYFPFENQIKKIKKFVTPSNPIWAEMNCKWSDATFPWSDMGKSDKFNQILNIVKEKVDTKHLDSAYKHKCDYFLTSDKRHITNNRFKLESLLNLKIYLAEKEKESFLKDLYKKIHE